MAVDTFRLQLQIRAMEKGMAQATAGVRGHLRALQGEVKRFNAQVKSLRAGASEFTTAARSLASPFRGLFSVLGGVLGLARTVFSAFSGFVMGVVGAVTRLAGAVLGVARAIGSVLWGVARRVFGGMLSLVQTLFGYMRTAAVVGVGALVGGLTMLARQGVKVNQSLLSVEKGLAVMLRSGTAAKELLADLRKEARTSGFEFVDLAGMTKRLLAFGFGKPEVLPMIRVLGDVAAGLEGGKDLLDRLILAFGQIRAKGKLMGQEALQLMEAGIPVRELLRVPVGVDVGELAMPAAEAIPKLLAGLQQRFGGLQQQLAQTLPGRISNIRDAVNDLSADVTKGLFASLTQAAGTVLHFLQNLQRTAAGRVVIKHITHLFNLVGEAIERAAATLPRLTQRLAAFLESKAFQDFKKEAVKAFQEVRKAVVDTLEKAKEAYKTFVEEGGLEKWKATAIGALRGFSKYVQDLMNWLKKSWLTLWDDFVKIAEGGFLLVGSLVAGFQNVWRRLIETKGVQQVFEDIGKGAKELIVLLIRGFAEAGVWVMKFMRLLMLTQASVGAVLSLFPATAALGVQLLAGGLAGAARITVGIGAAAALAEDAVQAVRGLSVEGISRAFRELPGVEDMAQPFLEGARQFRQGVEAAGGVLGFLGFEGAPTFKPIPPPPALPKLLPPPPPPPKPKEMPFTPAHAAAWREAFPDEPFPSGWEVRAREAGIAGPRPFGPGNPPPPIALPPRALESRLPPVEVHVDVKLEGLPEGVDARVERVVTEWAYRAVGVPT